MADSLPASRTPRWVKVFAVVGAVVILLFAVLHLTGNALGGHSAHHGHAQTPGSP